MSRLLFLIEDDLDDRDIFMMALEECCPDFRCEVAPNGVLALKFLGGNPDFVPDIIFLDLNMPRMGGKECFNELRKLHALEQTKIVIYTTSNNNRDKVELKSMGADAFITKPGTISELIDLLRTHLN